MITLQFVREDKFTSDLISWFSQGHLSHVEVVLPGVGLLGAYGSRVGNVSAGVGIRPFGYAKLAECYHFNVPATVAQEAAFYGFLRRQIGKPYDWQAIFNIALDRDWRAADSWICSELVIRAEELAGLIRSLFQPINKITPVGAALVNSALAGVTWERVP